MQNRTIDGLRNLLALSEHALHYYIYCISESKVTEASEDLYRVEAESLNDDEDKKIEAIIHYIKEYMHLRENQRCRNLR